MLLLGYEQTQINDRKERPVAVEYKLMRFHRLEQLRRSLIDKTYRPGAYVTFEVREPKRRLVSAPMLPDKIVQYGAHVLLEASFHDVFLPTSFACRGGQRKASTEKVLTELGVHRIHRRPYRHYGQHAASKHLQAMMLEVPKGWVAWIDCKDFFYSVDREMLKRLIRKRIGDERFLWLLDTIIDSSPTGERGLPLGNATSQNFANTILNELDQYSVRFLHVKRYMRYNDDVFATFASREEAKEFLRLARAFLRDRLHLTPHPRKSKISPVANGITALGFKTWPTHSFVKDQTLRRANHKLKMMFRVMAKLPAREIRPYRDKKVVPVIGSELGMLRWSNGYGYARKKFGHLNYIRIEDKRYYYGRKPRPRKEGNNASIKPHSGLPAKPGGREEV